MTCPYLPLELAWGSGLCYGCGKALKRNKDGSISKVRMWCGGDCALRMSRNHSWREARNYAVFLNGDRRGLIYPGPCAHCKEEITGTPEVNHIAPRYGRGYGSGCWNHQENLEVFCHRCHVAVTKLQRAAVSTGGQMRMETA